jgi:hypothetical protein
MINPQCHDLMEIVTTNNDSCVFEQRLSRLSLYQAYLDKNYVFDFFSDNLTISSDHNHELLKVNTNVI